MNSIQLKNSIDAQIAALQTKRAKVEAEQTPLEILWPIIGNAKKGVNFRRVEGEYFGNKVSGVITYVNPWGEGSISIDFAYQHLLVTSDRVVSLPSRPESLRYYPV